MVGRRPQYLVVWNSPYAYLIFSRMCQLASLSQRYERIRERKKERERENGGERMPFMTYMTLFIHIDMSLSTVHTAGEEN